MIEDDDVQAECPAHVPDSLWKAVSDPFDYALRLRTGEIIFFHTATIHGEWATLTPHDGDIRQSPHDSHCGLNDYEIVAVMAPRGLDVRIADIVWCADAPFDS